MIFSPRSLPLLGLLSAEFLSLLGNQVAAVAIPLLVLQFTQSPLAAGVAGAGNALPILFAALIGGKAIDRFGALRASIVADILSGLSTLALPLVLSHFSDISPLVIFALVAIGALLDPVGAAARQILVPSLTRLSGQSLSQVNSYRGALENGADLFGPIIGVAAIASLGAINTFFLNAASFLLCAMLLAIAIPAKKKPPLNNGKSNLFWGVRYIFGHSQLKAIAFFGAIANFVLLPFLGLLLPVLVVQKFASPLLLGWCLSAFGFAATLGALGFQTLVRWLSRSAIYYGGLMIAGVAIALCALARGHSELVLLAGFSGLVLGAGNPLEQTLLQESLPRSAAGQILTAHQALRFLFGPLGLVLAGFLSEAWDVSRALSLGGAILVISAIAGGLFCPLSQRTR